MSDTDAIRPASMKVMPMPYDNLRSLTIDQLCAANHNALKNVFTSAPQELRNKHASRNRGVYKLLALILSWREQLIMQENVAFGTGDDVNEMERMFSLSIDDL